MKRMLQVSLFALASFSGVLAGERMNDSSDAQRVENQDELAILAKEVARLRESVGRGRGPVGANEDREDAEQYEELDFAEIIAREHELAERRAQAITAVADREAVDSSWAPAVELQIADGLAAHGPPGAKLLSAICKTTLCIAEMEHPPGDDGTSHVNWLTVFGLSRGFFVRHEPESDTGARTMAYLVRDGYLLPSVEPSTVGSDADGQQ